MNIIEVTNQEYDKALLLNDDDANSSNENNETILDIVPNETKEDSNVTSISQNNIEHNKKQLTHASNFTENQSEMVESKLPEEFTVDKEPTGQKKKKKKKKKGKRKKSKEKIIIIAKTKTQVEEKRKEKLREKLKEKLKDKKEDKKSSQNDFPMTIKHLSSFKTAQEINKNKSRNSKSVDEKRNVNAENQEKKLPVNSVIVEEKNEENEPPGVQPTKTVKLYGTGIKISLFPALQKYNDNLAYKENLKNIRKIFADKKFNIQDKKLYQYVIMPGNASYLIKNCFNHRINWKSCEMKVTSIFNFKWQQNTSCIDYSSLSSMDSLQQLVNHFEYHTSISNKANLYINLFSYCEKNDINVFKYIPFTILISSYNSNEKNFESVFNNIESFIMNYEEINTPRQYFDNLKKIKKEKDQEELNKFRDKLYGSKFVNSCADFCDKETGKITPIQIPSTHYNHKNLWVLKATNLNRGQCIRVIDSVQKLNEIVKTYNQGIETNKKSKDTTDNNFQSKSIYSISQNIPTSHVFMTNKIILQKYIEKPLLYKGRKCDMRIWVLLSHEMKVYVFKEGHLKTCSKNYDINNSNDPTVHITNYSFQKHCENFQKFEIGNE
ncbi:MAG: tubulin--tyrosine ligase family protein, partial [archaeon]|nr:tubulin--tyrosine ligase family protein [archaeon]